MLHFHTPDEDVGVVTESVLLKTALKFKPVVVTAVFSVKKNYGPARLLRTCFSLSRVFLS